jgi:hypothetical protein
LPGKFRGFLEIVSRPIPDYGSGVSENYFPYDFDNKEYVMGGMGSGRPYDFQGSRVTCESVIRIDVKMFKRWGLFKSGTHRSLTWWYDGEPVGDVVIRVGLNHLIFNYRYRIHGGQWEPVEQLVRIDRTPCNFGGYRKWFLCPRCGKRVGVIYCVIGYFWCRTCNNLAYISQFLSKEDRLMHKAAKIFQRLGFDGGDLFRAFPENIPPDTLPG